MECEHVPTNSQRYLDPSEFTVSWPYIECGPDVSLPPICVLTGERIETARVYARLFHILDWHRFFLALCPVLLIFYLALRNPSRCCRVEYFISRKQRKFRRLTKFIGIGLLVVSLAVFSYGVTMPRINYLPMTIAIGLLCAAAVAFHFSVELLSISWFDGDRIYRLKGLSDAFRESAYEHHAEQSRKVTTRRSNAGGRRR